VTCRPKGTATGAYGMNGGPCVGRGFRNEEGWEYAVNAGYTAEYAGDRNSQTSGQAGPPKREGVHFAENPGSERTSL